jgi:alpha-glucosidase
MLLLTLRGTPTLYYGDELGLENGIITPERLQDPQGLRLGIETNRDVARTPMQWDGSPNAGFCASVPDGEQNARAMAEPWLPVSLDYAQRNVERQSQDPRSMLNLYRRLLALRRSTPALQGGRYRPVETGQPDCFAYLRERPGALDAGLQRILVALNFSSQPRRLSIPGEETGRVLLSTHLDREGETSLQTLELRGDEGVVVGLGK